MSCSGRRGPGTFVAKAVTPRCGNRVNNRIAQAVANWQGLGLRAAAETLSKSPASLQLRYLQTLSELGADHNSTVGFPLPVDIITPFLRHPELLEGIAGSINTRR